MKFKTWTKVTVFSCLLAGPALGQSTAAATSPPRAVETVIVTGSSIKRAVNDSALPIQIITRAEIEREGISSTEQLMMLLTSSGTGPENLASNADVVAGAQRGNNGASSANLRGQGSAGTLVLFNGRRVAAHGLNGGAVDINQIPLAAIERVDILKDGASAIYGTDAIGGVINYITKKNFQGLNAQTSADITEAGGSEIFRASLLGGFGDLNAQGFNIMASLSWSDNKALDGADRDWINGFQPRKGLSIDTRGAPFATIFPLNASINGGVNPLGSLLGGTAVTANGLNPLAPFLPGSTTVRGNGGVNTLDLPGGAGCNSIDGMSAYDELLWNNPSAVYACAWDTGRAVVLQQPITKYNFVSRAVTRIGGHEIAFEAMLSNSVSAKRFSNPQFSSGTFTGTPANLASNSNFLYPLNDITRATYNGVYTSLLNIFPTLGAPVGAAQPTGSRYGLPIAFRWRCIECGQREIETTTDTERFALTADGPLAAEWEYRTGLSYATSESSSLLGSGYYYRNSSALLPAGKIGVVDALNRGNINVFLPAGQTQTTAALADLELASAKGVTLFGGKFTVSQFDGTISGPLFNLPGGKIYAAIGFDLREENYAFNGDVRAAQAEVFLAPFDNANALTGVSRNISAIFGEIMLPLIKGMELTIAGRRDAYTGFGVTNNPKVSIKYRPFEPILFRGSYNTGFRVPSFNQIFNGVQLIAFPGATLADPLTCPGGLPDVTKPGCAVINPDIANGGRADLGPEKAEQMSFGGVWEPNANFSLSLDWWSIERTDSIVLPSVIQLRDNFALFPEAFIRDSTDRVVVIDARWKNAGESQTEGVEVGLRGRGNIFGGTWSTGLDGTYLVKKRSRLLASAPWSASEIGVFTFSGDLGLKWKHNIFFTYRQGEWTGSVSQSYRDGYTNGSLPGVANGSIVPPELVKEVDSYITYNTSVSYRGFKNFTITAGIKNLLDQDPPFAITYDSNGGSGGNWEPRVADPRGRSFTILLNYDF